MDKMRLTATERRQQALSRLARLITAEQMDTSRRGLIEAAGPTANAAVPRCVSEDKSKV